MKNFKIIFQGIALISILSCSASAWSIKTIQSNINIEQTIHDSLSFTLEKYINKISPFFESIGYDDIKRDCAYYCVLFFEINQNKYFMLFTWVGIPKYSPYVKKKTIYFYLHNNKKIALIDYKKNENPLFAKTKEAVINANNEAKKELCFIQDGSRYPETYKYKVENGNILIEKADSLFYESAVGNDFARFENLFVTMPNGYRKNKTHE
jgi:hypothetical protein